MTESVTGPFSEFLQAVTTWLGDVADIALPPDLHWQVLLLTLGIALAIWKIRGGHGSKNAEGRERKAGLVKFLLPRDIYTHVSARVDVGLWLLECLLQPLWGLALLTTVGIASESAVITFLEWSVGPSPALQPNYAWMLLYSLVLLLSYDFVFYITHYAMHRIPALWVLHRIHHSAEVLTPLTRYREHFLAGPIWTAGSGLSYGVAAGLFAYLFSGGITEATVLNIGFFFLLFGFNGSFRHYHVQFHYPRWLSKWLHSPAMHHIHHSYLPQHWDRNFAAVTSLWDRLFGTLYIPERDEYTPWGLGPESQADYRSFWQNTRAPFRDWYRMLRPEPGAATLTMRRDKPL